MKDEVKYNDTSFNVFVSLIIWCITFRCDLIEDGDYGNYDFDFCY